jgi:SPP1 gp7 family putative phage head morphogenesis protein
MPTKKAKRFKPSSAAETKFARALRQVARVSGHIVEAHVDGHTLHNSQEMQRALKEYSKLIEPWAKRQSAKMLEQVAKKNSKAFKAHSKLMGRLLKQQTAENQTYQAAQSMMHEQVELIQSLPVRAGERAQKLALEAVVNGTRADEIAKELANARGVSESQAMCIARTEVARANASINQARAQAVGSHQYIWRNSGDEAVRPAHKRYHGKKLDGMVFSWDKPPTLDDGTTGHPGTFPNCRCYAEPFFEED